MTRGLSIGVVGGGASAVCLLDTLAQADSEPGSITVYEPSPHLWRGRAYQVDTPTLKVNATPDDMSVRAGDLGHFERWLESRDLVTGTRTGVDPWSGARFVSRSLYGEYLEQSAYAALGALRRRGWRVHLLSEGVDSAVRTGDQVVLHSGAGRTQTFDYAVLCVGGDSPKDVYGLTGAPGFVPDPYPIVDRLTGFGPDEHVAVIGSGLTAVDIILSLTAQGHRGRISLLSRSGALPGVRQRPIEFELRHFTPERMAALGRRQVQLSTAELAEVMRAEFEDAGADLTAVTAEIAGLGTEDPAQRLRRQFEQVDSAELGLRILQRAVPETGPDVWPLLDPAEQAEVLRTHYRTVMSLCCPMPPDSAATLLNLLDQGQLELCSGVLGIEADGHEFLVETAERKFTVDRVVNAVNASEGKIPVGALPLVTSLTQAGAASRHPNGGLHVERATSRLTVDDRPDPHLYGLGNIAAGSLFFTFGVPSLVDRAVDIVAAVLDHATDRALRADTVVPVSA